MSPFCLKRIRGKPLPINFNLIGDVLAQDSLCSQQPDIDQLVDATYGHPRMSFLNAFQGYHQIALAVKDQEKIVFISTNANYHYTIMPFRLKNAGTTYQRMMTRMFRDKIGRMVEVYIDDMVVKSKWEKGHIDDLKEVFEVLWRHKLYLNADKCSFRVGAGKFLGYMITY